jgi:glycosyltransferase involved in cell wall biosynthesis
MSGVAKPLRWIGTRSYSGRFAKGNRDILPVLIKQGALAENTPKRDLYVSPLHAMFLNGVLIPALSLVNGISILQAETVDVVEYFHLELDAHDVIHAEGSLSETFVDDYSRGMFHNAASFRLLYPDAKRMPARYCAPRVEDGEELDVVRRALVARARGGFASVIDSDPHIGPSGRMRSHLDLVGAEEIQGWAWREETPNTAVMVRILDNGVAIGEVLADQLRGDLVEAGIGDGRYGFTVSVPGGLSPETRHIIQAQWVSDGTELHGSPFVIEALAQPVAPELAALDLAALQPVAPELAALQLAAPEPAAPEPIVAVAETAPAPSGARGNVETVTRDRIGGWVWDERTPDDAVTLHILRDTGEVIASVVANRYRRDLEEAGIGDGRHAFDVRIPGLAPLSRHVIHVRRAADGSELENSPVVIEAATRFDEGLEHAVTKAVAELGADGDETRVLSFLMAQADRLLQKRAEIEGQREAREAHQQFRRRWGSALPTGKGLDESLGLMAQGFADPGLRALVVDAELPHPDRDAGSEAILSHMRALQSLGYAVSFVAAQELAASGPAVAALEADGITCCRSPFYASVEDVLRRQTQCFDVIYLHRISNASKYMALARQYCANARILYSVADLHYLRVARQAEAEERPDLLAESNRLRLAECTATWGADAVITHSPYEAGLLREAVPGAQIHVVPWATATRRVTVPFDARHGVAFIGNYGHSPNVDAARFLAEEIMPLVWQRDPTIACLLVGSGMPETVKRLARPGLIPIGHVRELTAIFDRVRLTVAPIRYGAGVKGKVLTSLAAGVPCIMSPMAAEGIDLPPGLVGLVGHSAAELAALILHFHAENGAYRAACEAGIALMQREFGQAQVAAGLQAAIEGRYWDSEPLSRAAAD